MFEVLAQKTIIMAPLAFIIYILSAIALGWILYGLRGYKVWARRFGRYEGRGYTPSPQRVQQDYFGYAPHNPIVHEPYQPQQNRYEDYGIVPPQELPNTMYYEKEPMYRESTAAPTPYSTKDDLKVIEGIGPKIEEILNQNGIHTWHELAQTPKENISAILKRAGKRFQMHDPSSWSHQAELADSGKWKELEKYQDFLYAGQE